MTTSNGLYAVLSSPDGAHSLLNLNLKGARRCPGLTSGLGDFGEESGQTWGILAKQPMVKQTKMRAVLGSKLVPSRWDFSHLGLVRVVVQ